MTQNESQRAARYALAVLTFINLFNYLDRWVVAAVVESIKRSELHLSDTQLGFVGTGFIIVYTLTSPLFGRLGDRRARPPVNSAACASSVRVDGVKEKHWPTLRDVWFSYMSPRKS